MGTEVAPVVDLRSLSQSELLALAAASPYGADPRRRGSGPDADLLPPPKIDRAVFNESAGSRKQTFSRHRVATNLTHSLTPAAASAAAPTEEDSENRRIVYHLQRLFAGDDTSYLSPPRPAPEQRQALIVPPIAASAPPPAPIQPAPLPPSLPSLPDPELEVLNPNGVAVDLAKLAELVDPYGEEMRRRTAGLGHESELLVFMNGLEGQWGSRRRRRKFVDAAIFGDHLPRGWKLLLGLKRKEKVAWINCRRYVSPKGHQFATCKEVSSYLMSLLGQVEAKPSAIQGSEVVHDLNAVNSTVRYQQIDSTEGKQSATPVTSVALSGHQQIDSTEERQSAMPVTSVALSGYQHIDSTEEKQSAMPVTSVALFGQQQIDSTEEKLSATPVTSVALFGHQLIDSTEEKQSATAVTSVALTGHSGYSQQQKPHKNETQVEATAIECRKCNLTFHDQGSYVQHQLSFHQKKAKRRRVSASGEPGVRKDGKCETQEREKISEASPFNFGHGVADVREQGQSPGKPIDEAFSGVLDGQPSLAFMPSGFQEVTTLPEQKKEPSAGESDFDHHKDPLQEMTSFPEAQKRCTAGEPFSGHGKDHTIFSDDHDGAYCNVEESSVIDVASKLSTSNYVEVHEDGSSKDLKLFSTDYSQNFSTPDETCNIAEEVPANTEAPSESGHTVDRMDCTDATQSNQTSEPCDELDGKFGIVPEENNFNNQMESNQLSAALDEPDLNSIGMEIDNDNLACKYGDVVNTTSFDNDKSAEDKLIDCGMTTLKDDEINSDVRIRDVNLNSCLDTISSPISGPKYETSNALDDANQSSIIVQCFGANSNDDNACKDENFVKQKSASKAEFFINQNSASKVENFVNQNSGSKVENFVNQNSTSKVENFVDQKNDMMYQSNLTMGPISRAQVNVDCYTSCSMTSEMKNDGNRHEDNSKKHLANSQNISSNETGFDVEAYNNDIFNGTITESSLAQLNNAINMKTDFSSCYSLSDLNTLTGGTATDEIDIHGMRSSFVNSSTSREPNEHCTLDFNINGSMLEALEKSDSDLENQYNGVGPSCDSHPASRTTGNFLNERTTGNFDDFLSMQTNFGSLTSLVRAVEDVPLSRIIQDQCDLQLGFGGQKQHMFPSFEQQLRMASAGAPQFAAMSRHNAVPVPMSRHNAVPVPEPTLMLGYPPPQLPPVQIGWDMHLQKMVGGWVQSVCVWCNVQFQHFGTVAEQQADSLGFICPACKEKISGHLSMLNHGSSQL